MYRNKIILSAWKGKTFVTNSCLLAIDSNFKEKSKKFQKFKVTQASFQKEDGLPVFLKKGFRDKLLFNITWIGVVLGVLSAWMKLHEFDQKYK